MPQLSLYLDEATLKMVERAAKISNTSVSKWVCNRVLRSLKDEWPDDYFALFGSIKDDSFAAPGPIAPDTDAPREKL